MGGYLLSSKHVCGFPSTGQTETQQSGGAELPTGPAGQGGGDDTLALTATGQCCYQGDLMSYCAPGRPTKKELLRLRALSPDEKP